MTNLLLRKKNITAIKGNNKSKRTISNEAQIVSFAINFSPWILRHQNCISFCTLFALTNWFYEFIFYVALSAFVTYYLFHRLQNTHFCNDYII